MSESDEWADDSFEVEGTEAFVPEPTGPIQSNAPQEPQRQAANAQEPSASEEEEEEEESEYEEEESEYEEEEEEEAEESEYEEEEEEVSEEDEEEMEEIEEEDESASAAEQSSESSDRRQAEQPGPSSSSQQAAGRAQGSHDAARWSPRNSYSDRQKKGGTPVSRRLHSRDVQDGYDVVQAPDLPIGALETVKNRTTYDLDALLGIAGKIQDHLPASTTPTNHVQRNKNVCWQVDPMDVHSAIAQPIDEQPEQPKKKADSHKIALMNERFTKFLENKLSKTGRIGNELAEREVAECTFTPKTNVSGRATKRSVTEFLESQEKHVKHKQDFVAMMKEDLERQNCASGKGLSFRPKINKASQNLTTTEPAHERLFKLAKDPTGSKGDSVSVKQDSTASAAFVPTVNEVSKKMVRDKPIADRLFQLAKEREERRKNVPEEKRGKLISDRSEKFLSKKFLKEFSTIFDEIDVDKTGAINYYFLNELMQAMYFTHTCAEFEDKNYPQERALLVKMWRLLRRDEQVSKENLRVFLLAVMNYYLPSMSEDVGEAAEMAAVTDARSEVSVASDSLGCFDSDRFRVSETDAGRIHKIFLLFYENRNSVTRPSNVNPRPRVEVDEPTFHPQVSRGTEQKAEGIRAKRAQQASGHGGSYNREDYLIAQRKRKEEQIRARKEQLDKEEINQCSFRPKINTSTLAKPKTASKKPVPESAVTREYKSATADAQHKTLQLYSFAGKRLTARETQVQSGEAQRKDREVEGCTFRPVINQYRQGQTAEHCELNPATLKQIERIRQAREASQLTKAMLERGYCYPQNLPKSESRDYILGKKDSFSSFNLSDQNIIDAIGFDKGDASSQSEHDAEEEADVVPPIDVPPTEPLVTVDINLPNGVDQIVIYPGDIVEQLAEQFAMKHSLEAEMTEKLVTMLKSELAAGLEDLDSDN